MKLGLKNRFSIKLNILLWSLICLNLASSSVFAYKPLLGSDWAKKNPNQLPYTNCFFRSNMYDWPPNNFEGWSVGAIASTHGWSSQYLYCYSDKVGTEFIIPVKFSYLRSLGLTAMGAIEIGSWLPELPDLGRYHFEVKNLQGKYLSSLVAGTYEGSNFSLAIIQGVWKRSLKNEQGISIKGLEGSVALGIDFSTMWGKLEFRKYLRAFMCNDQRLIIDRTDEQRTAQDCSVFSPSQTKIEFNHSKLEKMMFIKD